MSVIDEHGNIGYHEWEIGLAATTGEYTGIDRSSYMSYPLMSYAGSARPPLRPHWRDDPFITLAEKQARRLEELLVDLYPEEKH